MKSSVNQQMNLTNTRYILNDYTEARMEVLHAQGENETLSMTEPAGLCAVTEPAGLCTMTEPALLCNEMVCDTPVPYYRMGVSCGLPNEFGDVAPESMWVPAAAVAGLKVYALNANGDSMEGVGIHNGDVLMIEVTTHYNPRDIVVAVINGEQTLKTYYVDDAGRHWLVPANPKYDPLLLTEEMDVRFQGRVMSNLRKPCDTLGNIRQCLSAFKQKHAVTDDGPKVPSVEDVREALVAVAPQITKGRHWLGPCRVLMDCGCVARERYDVFCEMVCDLLPDHPHLPQEAELRRMAVDCFSKAFALWKEDKAPVHGKSYRGYHDAGAALLEKLP